MTPFDLIGTKCYRGSPFSVPCPHCGSVATYQPEKTKTFPSHASRVAVEYVGETRDVVRGTLFGECRCNDRDCQEFTHFLASYSTEFDDSEQPAVYLQVFILKYFFPAIPFLRMPEKTPTHIKRLLRRSFAPAFSDCSASGNLLRSCIEAILTDRGVRRFVTSKARRRRLTFHERLYMLPGSLESHKEKLLAAKWIGNTASHDELSVSALRVGYSIVEDFLEELYGTRTQDLEKIIRRINKRRKP
jgi:Domain of unknown function (DUF4145)